MPPVTEHPGAGDAQGSGLPVAPGRAPVGAAGGGALPVPGQQVVLRGRGAGWPRAGGARCVCRGCWCAESCGLRAPLPPAPALLHFKEHPRAGVPRAARSPVAALQRGRLYSCQADREELTLPTRLLPRPQRPGAHFNPLGASGARPGRPSCLLTAAWPGSSQQGGRLPGPGAQGGVTRVQRERPLARGRRGSRASRGGPGLWHSQAWNLGCVRHPVWSLHLQMGRLRSKEEATLPGHPARLRKALLRSRGLSRWRG